MAIKLEYLPVSTLKPYKKNARRHKDLDVSAIAKSIQEFGFNDPIGIWGKDNTIVEGHGRLMAAIKLGIEMVPCIRLDELTDEQRRAYALAHNKTAELSEWDFNLQASEIAEIQNIDMREFGFDIAAIKDHEWFADHETGEVTEEDTDEYAEFVNKFEPKRTTDDCYTPAVVYDAIADWVSKEFNINRERFVRPFYPGGDYKAENYPDGCAVVDNPPFSILAEIIRWYSERKIPFFLFAPTMTLFSSAATTSATSIPMYGQITYENGATVDTSFVTNLTDPDLRVWNAPELYTVLKEANDKVKAEKRVELPKYSYPDYVITSAMVAKWGKYGVEYKLRKAESVSIDALDSQKEEGKEIYGKGFLLSERAAAERAAAERAAAERAAAERAAAERAAAMRWEISDREKEIIRSLGD